jgi:hypothetical protein
MLKGNSIRFHRLDERRKKTEIFIQMNNIILSLHKYQRYVKID